MMKFIRHYAPVAVLICILLAAAYLRLYKISAYMTFLGDEGRDMLVVKHMIVDHKFTLLGPTASVGGFFLGPIYYYFMLPFVWLWHMDPSGAAVMVALFGIATVWLMYHAISDMFGRRVGLLASALYALSPLVIAYSRSSWNPNLVPFFSLGIVYFLWKSVVREKPRLLFWVGVGLGIGLQLHYLFLFMFPVVLGWYLLFGRKKKWIPSYALGILGFLVGYGPFLAFELRHGFPNTISIYRFLMEGKDTGFVFMTFVTTLGDVTYRLFGRLLYRLPPPEQWKLLPASTKQWWALTVELTRWIAILLLAVKGTVLLRMKKVATGARPSVLAYTLLALWFVIPVLLFGLYKKAIYDYYFGILFPLPFILLSLIASMASRKRIGAAVVVPAFAFLLWFNWQGRPFVSPPNNQLGQARFIATEALAKADGKPFNFALMANFNSDHAYRYFFEVAGNAPVTIENLANDPERKTVTDQLIVICELPECKPLGASLWEIAGFGRAEIAGEWQVSFVKVIRLVHYQGSTPK
jgi:4-amino-4-deoxy-L-arabinose transferase-like glycosyltransferase